MTDVLESATKALLAGVEDGLHVGAQLHVRRAGEVVEDLAIGIARDGVRMTADTSMIWFSSTKAVTAVAAAMVWERGGFGLDDPVAHHLPAFGANGKDAVTVRHLLTHTGGFRFAGHSNEGPMRDMDDSLPDICAAPLEENWVPGRKAGYHPAAGMTVLAALVAHVDGRPFRRFVRDEIFLPLRMDDCWVGMSEVEYETASVRFGVMHNTDGEPLPLPLVDAAVGATRCIPGAGGRGPMAQLANLYEMLRGNGELDGVRLLRPQTVAAITVRHRAGMFDHTFGIVIDWGLGFILDSLIYGTQSSTRTFGHGGARSSVAFCDPEADLVVALVFNGMAERSVHYGRLAAVVDAIYDDLGLRDPDGGHDRPMPSSPFL